MVNVSVVGLGKLGSPLATWISSKGYTVVGVDANSGTVGKINLGVSSIQETGLQELLEQNRFQATTDTQEAVLKTDITFIIVNTPSNDGGDFSLRFVEAAAQEIALALRKKETWHLVVVTSTIMPGDTRKIQRILETLSGKRRADKTGRGDFGLAYNPEFIALGSVLHDLQNPDFVLVGYEDYYSWENLCTFYKEMGVTAPIYATSFVNAELAKLSLNAYVTMKISFANMLARLCETIPEANVDEVTRAIGNDTRIGSKYLKGGVPFGGPCFPRDGRALLSLAPDENWESQPLTRAVQVEQELTHDNIMDKIIDYTIRGDIVLFIGGSYKIGSPVTDESPTIRLGKELEGYHRKSTCFDSTIMNDSNLEKLLEQAGVVVIMLPYKDFQKKDLTLYKNIRAVIDPWRCFHGKTGAKLIQCGVG